MRPHDSDNEIKLIKDDYNGRKDLFLKKVDKSGVAVFEFIYSKDFPEATVLPENYGFKI